MLQLGESNMRKRSWWWRVLFSVVVGAIILAAWGYATSFVFGAARLPDWVYITNIVSAVAISEAVSLVVYHKLTYERFPIAGETRCRSCGYILRGLTEPRCSECGERI